MLRHLFKCKAVRFVTSTHHAVVGDEGQEGRFIGENVSAHLLGHDEAGTHAGVGGDVPVGVVLEALGLGRDAQLFRPEADLLGVRAGTVTAGDKGVLAVGNGLEGGLDVSGVLDARGVGGRAAEDEEVVHPVQTLIFHAVDHIREAVGNEGLLLLLGVHQDQIGVAHLGVGDGLAGTGGINLDLVWMVISSKFKSSIFMLITVLTRFPVEIR